MEQFSEVEVEEVLLEDAAFERWHVSVEPCHAFSIDFHDSQSRMLFEQELCQYPHPGPYLHHRQALEVVEGGGNASCHIEVGQKMLAECFLGSYLLHGVFVKAGYSEFF